MREGVLDMGDVMAVAGYVNRYRTTNPQDTAKALADATDSGKVLGGKNGHVVLIDDLEGE